MLALCLIAFLSGCMQNNVQDVPSTAKTSTTRGASSLPEAIVKESCPTLPYDCVKPPLAGCSCVQWSCPAQSTAETTVESITTTTCVLVPDLNYTTAVLKKTIVIYEGKFRPSNINANVGDIVIVTVTSRQGLHKIRETSSNQTFVIGPGESHEMIFQADEEGSYLLTCNPYCEDPMEATITLRQPYKEVC